MSNKRETKGHFLCNHKNVVFFCLLAEILKCSSQDLSEAFDVREQTSF